MTGDAPTPEPKPPASAWPRTALAFAVLSGVPWVCVSVTLTLREYDSGWFICSPVSSVLGWGLLVSGLLQLVTGFFGVIALVRPIEPSGLFAVPILSAALVLALPVAWPSVVDAFVERSTHAFCADTGDGYRLVHLGDGRTLVRKRERPDAGLTAY